jgi:hypothetical protein
MKNTPKAQKKFRKILEMTWDMMNPDKRFGCHEKNFKAY